MAKNHKNVADYIEPLYMNGLQGRMLRLPGPPKKNKEILLVYGHHSTLERWWGLIDLLGRYGTVTVPDLPGFGGMESFYKLGEKPTIDNLADYLAAFVKMHYKRKKCTIVGLSFGFVIATRMLQRYPELTKKVDVLVSLVGFTRKDDFTFSKSRVFFYKSLTYIFITRPMAAFFKNVFLNPVILRLFYARTHNAKDKFSNLTPEEAERNINFEVYLWHANDLRTWLYTSRTFFSLDNCKQQVDLPVWHVGVKADRYFDNTVVEQHMRIIFSAYHEAIVDVKNHAPSVVADAAEISPLLPTSIRRILSKS